ncbi:hypothetical protein LSH36_49g07011 [Paralvinella palmiformis]|uniref:ubiquitinyl hydrolase 1 n=1 Tax=Paralvinella palmiformis TaxID=53620 RepID=A0AAD9K6E8_9ANNE|nr:hypothetical protein LSH36_49g07011 [Paralvinella palmiformis]
MSGAGEWCLIESDPGVFTELIKGFGLHLLGPSSWQHDIAHGIRVNSDACVKGVQVEELWSLDPENFENLRPIHGLIFLFKWKADDEPQGSLVMDNRLDKIFFAKQVINNACATQAILSILLNCSHPNLELGKDLTTFKEFVMTFDPATKGLSLSNSNVIRSVHNSFARQQMFEFDQKAASKDDDVYHFVSYMPIEGRLYELDGLKEGPIDHGQIPTETDWLDVVRPILEKRIQKYSADEIHFNLMAVMSDRRSKYQKRIDEINQLIQSGTMETDDLHSEISKLELLIKDEQNKMDRYKVENIRRKHNYLPFIMEMLKILAQEGKLVNLVEKVNGKPKAVQQALVYMWNAVLKAKEKAASRKEAASKRDTAESKEVKMEAK